MRKFLVNILGVLCVVSICGGGCNGTQNSGIIDALRSSDGYLDSAYANRLNKILTDTTLLRKPDFPPDTTYLTDTFSIKNYPLKEYIIRDKNFFRQLDNVIATNINVNPTRKYINLVFYDDVLGRKKYEHSDSFFVIAYFTNRLWDVSAFVKSGKYVYVSSDTEALSSVAQTTNRDCELEEVTIEMIERTRMNQMVVLKYDKGQLSYMNPDKYSDYYISFVE